MGEATPDTQALCEEIKQLRWRISTLETVETECARALNALAVSEARYRRLLDEAGFPITISTTSDSTILFANPQACALFGLDGPVPAGRKILEFYCTPEDRQGLVAHLRAKGPVSDWDMLMVNGRRQTLDLLVAASLIQYQGQEAVLATSNDLTPRRHAEALFHTMVETSPDGFVIADLEGRLTYVSPRILEMFGYTDPEKLLGRFLPEFTLPESRELVAERLLSLLKGNKSGPTEFLGVRPDGSTFFQETNGEVLRNSDGSPHAFFFIIRDLSNRKRLERSIRFGEKLESLGLMAAGIAHELNNAFQVTRGHLELLQGMDGLVPGMDEGLVRIGGGVDRATSLAKEMLDYSGRSLREDASLDLNHVVEEGLHLWQGFMASQTRLSFVPGQDLPAVSADEGQVMKVLSAFVLNALEATEATEATEALAGAIVLRTTVQELSEVDQAQGFWPAMGRSGRFLCLEVQDQGPGIPAEQVERVCDPFFTTKGQGRGLGLSAALGILRSHAACLQILSEPGSGTTLRAYLPCPTHGHRSAAPQVASRSRAPGILVAEDDDGILDLVVGMLYRWGYGPVFAARNGAEALGTFRANQELIGILLTDASMPQMSGPEAFEAMRKLSPSLAGVLMTGYSEAFGRGTAAAFGFSSFLQKPFKFKELKARLEVARNQGSDRREA